MKSKVQKPGFIGVKWSKSKLEGNQLKGLLPLSVQITQEANCLWPVLTDYARVLTMALIGQSKTLHKIMAGILSGSSERA